MNVVVLGCGNPGRGDDGLGPALMERVEGWIRRHPDASVAAVEDFQFQVEHTLDLQGRDLILFLDAAGTGPDPFALRSLAPALDPGYSSHALSPSALLHAFLALDFGPPPPAFALGVRGHDFALGRELSPQARANLEAAWALVERLLAVPSRSRWEEACTRG